MWWIKHSHSDLLVVILIIDKHRVLAFERKRQTPIAAHAHGPMPLQLATQSMTFPARPLHILNSDCIIQNVEFNGKPCRVLWLNACLRASLEELLDAFVPKAPDHATIVYRNATLYDIILPKRMVQSGSAGLQGRQINQVLPGHFAPPPIMAHGNHSSGPGKFREGRTFPAGREEDRLHRDGRRH
jgi:hypothetical protein